MRFRVTSLIEDTIRAHGEVANLRPQESLSLVGGEHRIPDDDVKRDIITFAEVIEANGDFTLNTKD